MPKNMNLHMHTIPMEVECLKIRGKRVSDVIFKG